MEQGEFYINISGSQFVPDKFEYTSGLSMIWVSPGLSAFGVIMQPYKIQCAECNTPVAEIAGGSLIIRSKHHSKRHVTAFSKQDLINLL